MIVKVNETVKPDVDYKAQSQRIVDRHNAIVREQMALNQKQMEAKLLKPSNTKRPTATIPTWYIVKEGYYIGFDETDGGAYVVSIRYPNLLMQIISRKVKTGSMDINDPNFASNMKEYDDPNFNILKRDEFDKILAAKPSWQVLNAAYRVGVAPASPVQLDENACVFKDNKLERMHLPNATVVL